MKPKFQQVLEMAIEQGVERGLHRFYKHRDDAPDAATFAIIAENIFLDVSNAIYEWFDFEEGEE